MSLLRFPIISFTMSIFCFTALRTVTKTFLLVSTSVSFQGWSCLIFFSLEMSFSLFLFFFSLSVKQFWIVFLTVWLLNCGDFGFCYFFQMSVVSFVSSGYYLSWDYMCTLSFVETPVSVCNFCLLLICFELMQHMHGSGPVKDGSRQHLESNL